MKKLMTFVLALAAVTGVSAIASTPRLDVVKVTINESFMAGQTTLPAGNYVVRPLDMAGDDKVLVIESEAEGGSSILVPTNRVFSPREANEKPTLVFQRQGGKLVLTTVWTGAAGQGYELLGTARAE